MEISAFGARMRELGTRVATNADRLVKDVAVVTEVVLVRTTPIDTGRAISNWRIGVGSPAAGIIDAHAPGLSGSTFETNADVTIALAKAEISQYREGQDLHITNNLEYISDLDNGSSVQAPTGMSAQAVLIGAAVVRDTNLLAERVTDNV